MMEVNPQRLERTLEEAKLDASIHFEYWDEPITTKERIRAATMFLRSKTSVHIKCTTDWALYITRMLRNFGGTKLLN